MFNKICRHCINKRASGGIVLNPNTKIVEDNRIEAWYCCYNHGELIELFDFRPCKMYRCC